LPKSHFSILANYLLNVKLSKYNVYKIRIHYTKYVYIIHYTINTVYNNILIRKDILEKII